MAGRLGHLFRCHKNAIPSANLILKQQGCSYVRREFHRSAACCEKWQLMSAVCLERFPVLTAPLSDMERKFSEMMAREELENSLLCDHELRHRDDQKAAERRKQENYEESEVEAVRQTAGEAEDGWEAELKTFTPADRITDADRNNDQKSTERQLDRKLVLVMKQRLGSQSHWVLPKGPRSEGESMREAAERVLTEACGDQVEARFMGNAPCGFIKYRFDKETPEGVGAKVFFFKAQLQAGSVKTTNKNFEDYLWLTKEELPQHLGASYEKTVNKFILEL